MVIVLIVIVLLLATGGGYIGHQQWGQTWPYAGGGIGLGTVLLVLLICWMVGLLR